MAGRPSTPPPMNGNHALPTAVPLTPEQVRRMEESRLRAKARRGQQDAAAAAAGVSNTRPSTRSSTTDLRSTTTTTTTTNPASTSTIAAGQKRPFAATLSTSTIAPTQRDARQPSETTLTGQGTMTTNRPHDDITSARKFTKYVEYDFSKMTDTKGGFLTSEDDPNNRAMQTQNRDGEGQDGPGGARPAHMTAKEWERHQLLKKLREQRAGPFEPGLSVLSGVKDEHGQDLQPQGCAECGTLEIDFRWLDIFGIRVCNTCKEKLPDKYSLLTKTEARTDYLLTEPELKDRALLPALERPNPHKATWNNMQLFLRCQVEAYAFSERRWGSAEALDREFAKREEEKKKRKEGKFRGKLEELRKRTRVEAYRRQGGIGKGGAAGGGGGGGGAAAGMAQFGDKLARGLGERHEHEWGRTLVNAEGMSVKRCVECGMEVEQLEF